MPAAAATALGALLPMSRRDFAAQSAVFLLYFITAVLALEFYIGFKTSPAAIWPPLGIAIAAVIYGGYRMWLPIFLGQFLASSLLLEMRVDVLLVIAAGYAIEAMFALWILKTAGFEPRLDRLRNVLLLLFSTALFCMVEPAIATLYQIATNTLVDPPILNFGRTWGAGLFSTLVIVPLVAGWIPFPKIAKTRAQVIELIAAFLLLSLNNYVVFWTTYPRFFGIAVIFFLPAVLIWFALRFPPRWMALAVLHTAIVGVAGTVVANPSGQPLPAQLLAVEIYIGLIAAIFYVFVTVVEERRAAYKRLEEAYESTFAADQAKNEFISILAHELRNPLAPIVSALELLKLEPQTEEASRTIENAQEHTRMIRRLLDDLLDTARLSQNKFTLQKETVRIGDLIEQSVASVSTEVNARDHVLSVAVSDPEMQLFADPVRIKQIIINLLTNAARYTPPGGRIELSCLRVGDSAVVRVRDSGIGIDKADMDTLFEPFKQVGNVRAAGLGIGLFISKRLAEMHDGTLTVESEGKGKGSTFTLKLLIPHQLSLPSLDRVTHKPKSGVAAKILVVDDNESAANALKKLLQHYGHTVETAFSGQRALEKTETFKPELILLDIGMPDMDGYEVALTLRASKWNGMIVALTGYGQESDKQKARAAGCDYHLVKPVSVADVMGILAGQSATALRSAAAKS